MLEQLYLMEFKEDTQLKPIANYILRPKEDNSDSCCFFWEVLKNCSCRLISMVQFLFMLGACGLLTSPVYVDCMTVSTL